VKRPISIIAAAIVLLLYGIVILMGAVELPRLAFRNHPGETMRIVKGLALPMLRLIIVALGTLVTAYGLLRLRRWARWSILSISTGMVGLGAYFWISVYLTLPNHGRTGGPSPLDTPLGMALIVMLILVVPGTWWLILFTRPSVEAQFTEAPRSFPEPPVSSEDASSPDAIAPSSSAPPGA
jgi:hypothetical protein